MDRTLPIVATVLIGAALLFGYVVIRPALFIVILSGIALTIFYAVLTPVARRDVGAAPAAIAIALPIAAWLLPGIWLLYAAMLVAIPLAARRPGQVAPLYLFSLFLLPALKTTAAMGSLKLFDFSVQGALGCGAALWVMLHPRWRARVGVVYDLPALLLMLLLTAALARGSSATNALRMAINVGIDCGLPYYIVSRGVRSMDDVRRCMLHIAAAAAILSTILIYEVAKAWPIYRVLYQHYAVDTVMMVKNRGGLMRASGPFDEATSPAMLLAFCLLAAWMSRGAFRSRFHHLALLAVLLAGLLPSQSRGAWLGLITGMAAIDLYRGRLRETVMRFGVIGVAGLGLLAVAQRSASLGESLGMGGQSADTVDYRERLLERGLEELAGSPLIGFPLPEVIRRLSDLTQGEGIVDFVNSHLFIALIGGVIGLAIFIGAFVAYLVRLWRQRRHWRREAPADTRAAAFVFAALATPIEMLAFTSFIGRVQVFMFAFFALGVAVARARAQRSGDQARSGSPTATTASPIPAPTAAALNSASSSRASNTPIRYSADQL